MTRPTLTARQTQTSTSDDAEPIVAIDHRDSHDNQDSHDYSNKDNRRWNNHKEKTVKATIPPLSRQQRQRQRQRDLLSNSNSNSNTHPSLFKKQSSEHRRRDKEQAQNERMIIRTLRRQDSLTTTATTELSFSTCATEPTGRDILHMNISCNSVDRTTSNSHANSNTNINDEQQLPHDDNTTTPPSSSQSSSPHGSFRHSIMRHDLVRAVIHDYYDDLNNNRLSKSREIWNALFEKYHSPTYTMIRPTGNPISSREFTDMFAQDDLQLDSFQLISIDSVQLIAEATVAIATYTVDQRFSYKGIQSSDRTVLTCVLEECNGDVKMCHEQRTLGRSIPTQETRWNST